MAEIEVYQDGVNLADDAVAKVSASYDAKRFPASNLTDGDYGTPLTQRGIWVLPEKKLGWARIVWDRPNWGR